MHPSPIPTVGSIPRANHPAGLLGVAVLNQRNQGINVAVLDQRLHELINDSKYSHLQDAYRLNLGNSQLDL
jgi:hypothetical protein